MGEDNRRLLKRELRLSLTGASAMESIRGKDMTCNASKNRLVTFYILHVLNPFFSLISDTS